MTHVTSDFVNGREAVPCSLQNRDPCVEMAAVPKTRQALLLVLPPQSFFLPLLCLLCFHPNQVACGIGLTRIAQSHRQTPQTKGWILPPGGSPSNAAAGGAPRPPALLTNRL